MKKLAAVVVLVSGIIFLLIMKKESSPEIKTATKPVQTSPRVSLKNSKYVISVDAKSENTFPAQCHSSLKDLASMTMDEYKDVVVSKEALKTFFGEDCFEKLVANTTYKHLMEAANCQEYREKSCLTLLFMLKAYFIADHSKDKNPSEMTSQELASHFVKMFFSLDSLDRKTFHENLKLLNVFLDMHRDDPDVQEAYLGYLMIGKQITQDSSVAGKIEELLAASSGDSFKLDRLKVIKEVIENNLDSAKAKLDRLKEQYPQEPDVAYYQAAYYWKQGNREMAATFLDQAIQLSKNCVSCSPDLYAETKKKLGSSQDKDEKLFSISIGLNFENL